MQTDRALIALKLAICVVRQEKTTDLLRALFGRFS